MSNTTGIETSKKKKVKKYVQLALSEPEHIALKLIANKYGLSINKLLRESIYLWIIEKKRAITTK